jgi:hypothetical protein
MENIIGKGISVKEYFYFSMSYLYFSFWYFYTQNYIFHFPMSLINKRF